MVHLLFINLVEEKPNLKTMVKKIKFDLLKQLLNHLFPITCYWLTILYDGNILLFWFIKHKLYVNDFVYHYLVLKCREHHEKVTLMKRWIQCFRRLQLGMNFLLIFTVIILCLIVLWVCSFYCIFVYTHNKHDWVVFACQVFY